MREAGARENPGRLPRSSWPWWWTACPKTRSGKILRATMVKIADGEAFKMPATIDDPAILDEIATALQTLGLPAAKAG